MSERDIRHADWIRKRRRTASLPDSGRETADHESNRNRQRRRRASMPESQREIDRSRDKARKQTVDGPILTVPDRRFVGIARRPVTHDLVQRYSIGDMSLTCSHCKAVFFPSESSGTKSSPQFSSCCGSGRLIQVLKRCTT